MQKLRLDILLLTLILLSGALICSTIYETTYMQDLIFRADNIYTIGNSTHRASSIYTNEISDGTNNITPSEMQTVITNDPNDYDEYSDLPVAVVSDGDTTHIPNCDNVRDWCEFTHDYFDRNSDTVDNISDGTNYVKLLASIAAGDMIYRTNAGGWGIISIGGNDKVLTVDGSYPNWESAGGASGTKIQDADADTFIDTEVTSDCDSITMKVGGAEVFYANDKGFRDYGLLANTTVNLDNSMSAVDIQALIDACPKYIPYGKTLTFQFVDGTYTLSSQLTFEGFHGGGLLYIYGNSSDSSLSITKAVYLDFDAQDCNGIAIYGCSCQIIKVCYLKISVKTNTAGSAGIYVSGSTKVSLFYNYILGTSTTNGYGVYIVYGSTGYVYSTYVSNMYAGIYANISSFVASNTNDETGTDPKYGLYASYTTICKNGTQPAGSTANEGTSGGGIIR